MEIHHSLLKRKIIHIDMDCFYAAVEMRDNPALKSLPLVIGGTPDSRGVVCTANYEARKYGIKSAMPCSKAYRLCKKAIFIPPDFLKYRAVSQKIQRIFLRYTPLVQPLSLDEAYLDVTGQTDNRTATEIASDIRSDIAEETGITGSAGVAPNKMLSKIASDINKPDGFAVIKPHKVREFMGSLPLRKIPGIGPAFENRLGALKLVFCSDLWSYSSDELVRLFGDKAGLFLYERSRGIDTGSVEPHRSPKSIGHEETYIEDLSDQKEIQRKLAKIAEKLQQKLTEKKISGYTVTVKVKFSDFRQVTRSQSYSVPVSDLASVSYTAAILAKKCLQYRCNPVRLIGITISNLTSKKNEQSPLIVG